MNRMRRLFFAALPAVFAGGLPAAETAMTPEQIRGAERIEAVTIPMPGEFFSSIGKLNRPNWVKLVRTGTPAATANRAQIALMLGTLVADGYIAVEAQDSQGVKNIGKEIISLAKKLNVSQRVLGRGNSLNDFASNNDWSALREELEATQNEVKLDMEEQKDESLVILVSLGAWVRGTAIVSGLVDSAYTPESARLLRQPALIEYLLHQIDVLPAGLQKDPLIAGIRANLEKSLTFVKAATPTDQDIKNLHRAIADIVEEITRGSSES
ncbi:MAG: hypothetical protein WCQ57_10720 [Verrucomicrobiota bacterium]